MTYRNKKEIHKDDPAPQQCSSCDDDNIEDKVDKSTFVGQHQHMDYGFMQGSDWSKKDNARKLVTNVDKYRSYLFVINKRSRYIWIFFLTKTKSPSLEQLDELLTK